MDTNDSKDDSDKGLDSQAVDSAKSSDLPTLAESEDMPAPVIQKLIEEAEERADTDDPVDGIAHPHLHPADAEQKEAMETSIGVITALEVGAHRPHQLYLSRVDREFSGVCGGIGERLNTDPNIVRVVMILLTPFTFGLPLLVYLFLAWRLHVNPEHSDEMVRESMLIPKAGHGWLSNIMAGIALLVVLAYILVATYLVMRTLWG